MCKVTVRVEGGHDVEGGHTCGNCEFSSTLKAAMYVKGEIDPLHDEGSHARGG